MSKTYTVEELLAKYFKAYKPYEGEAEQTLDALYLLIVGCVPEEQQVKGYQNTFLGKRRMGFNQARTTTLEAINKVFGRQE